MSQALFFEKNFLNPKIVIYLKLGESKKVFLNDTEDAIQHPPDEDQ
jgi:hypothetical protein